MSDDTSHRRLGHYELGPQLGKGPLFTLRLAVDTRSGTTVVVRTAPLHRLDPEWISSREFREHVVAIRRLSEASPHIVRLLEVMLSPRHCHFVSEFCIGGPVMNAVMPGGPRESAGRFDEDEARWFFQQLVGALWVASLRGIPHGDLRPSDLLLDRPLGAASAARDRVNLKVDSFGLLRMRLSSTILPRAAVGEAHFTAPELLFAQPVLAESSIAKADLFSLGALLYVLLTGAAPFAGHPTAAALVAAIDRGEFLMPSTIAPGTRGPRYLIARLLDVDWSKRATLKEVVRHPWFDIRLDRTLKELFG